MLTLLKTQFAFQIVVERILEDFIAIFPLLLSTFCLCFIISFSVQMLQKCYETNETKKSVNIFKIVTNMATTTVFILSLIKNSWLQQFPQI